MLRVFWQGPRVSQILRFVGHAYGHYPLCAFCSCSQPELVHNLAQYVGKGRQQTAGMELSDMDAAVRAGYALYRALVTQCHDIACR